jgi:hypothetical protein
MYRKLPSRPRVRVKFYGRWGPTEELTKVYTTSMLFSQLKYNSIDIVPDESDHSHDYVLIINSAPWNA